MLYLIYQTSINAVVNKTLNINLECNTIRGYLVKTGNMPDRMNESNKTQGNIVLILSEWAPVAWDEISSGMMPPENGSMTQKKMWW